MPREEYRFGPISSEWKGPWKNTSEDPPVTEEAYTLASELLSEMVQRINPSSYARGDFYGDRTLYLETKDPTQVTPQLLDFLRGWLRNHPIWRVVIPVGKHEDAIVVYKDALFMGTQEVLSGERG